MNDNTVLFDENVSFLNKTILNIGNDRQLIDFLSNNHSKMLYLYPGNLKYHKTENDKIRVLKFNDCEKIIDQVDTILFDLDWKNKNEYETLKCIMEVLAEQNLNSNLELIMLKKTKTGDEKQSMYQDLIIRFWEGLIRFKNLYKDDLMPKIRHINLSS